MSIDVFTANAFDTTTQNDISISDSGEIDIIVDSEQPLHANSDFIESVSNLVDTEMVSFSRSFTNGIIQSQFMGMESSIVEVCGEGDMRLLAEKLHTQFIRLGEDDSITLRSEYFLAATNQTDVDVFVVGGMSGEYAGGEILLNLDGPSVVLIATESPVELFVAPIKTDPNTTVGWDGGRVPRTDGNLLGLLKGAWEKYELDFRHPGFVIVEVGLSPSE